MNFLFVTFGLPYPPDSGARLRDYNLIKRVARKHHVWVLSLLEFEDELQHAKELEQYCEVVDGTVMGRSTLATALQAFGNLLHRRPVATTPFYYPAFAEKIGALTATQQFDVVQFEHSFLASYRGALASGFDGLTVLSMHNIGVQQYRSILEASSGLGRIPAALKHRLMKNWEVEAANRFQQVITVSKCDRNRLLEMGAATDIAVIENGVDCAVLEPLPSPGAETEEIIFIGTMGYLPNRDAARYMVEEIFPLIRAGRPDCQLNLVGSGGREHLMDLAEPGVIDVTGRVKDPRTCYAKSRLAVVPLRSGGGSRLKILEAMALGCPVVSTTLGREGLELEDGVEILTADDPVSFAAHVINLLEDESLRRDIARAGRARVEKQYDWDLLADQLLDLYQGLAGTEIST